jgi:hypothetical protein
VENKKNSRLKLRLKKENKKVLKNLQNKKYWSIIIPSSRNSK